MLQSSPPPPPPSSFSPTSCNGSRKWPSYVLNELISAANENEHDRFQLLEDPTIPTCNLDNAIHPIFNSHNFPSRISHMDQALRLASLYLQHDTCLEFFIPLVSGRRMIDTMTRRQFIQDILAGKTPEQKRYYLPSVRKVFRCLAHSLTIDFNTKAAWGATKTSSRFELCTHCQANSGAKVHISPHYLDFYRAEYAKSSPGAQLRHDFHFANTLTHEIVHAVGVMLRGNLNEPWIRLDHPTAEWGFAWENFMFGCIMNPYNSNVKGTGIIIRRPWSKDEDVCRLGGKQYDAVPLSYVAQWFQKSTWDLISQEGPLRVPPPSVRLRIWNSTVHGCWVVQSNCINTSLSHGRLLQVVRREMEDCLARQEAPHRHIVALTKSRYHHVSSRELQMSNLPMPLRVSGRLWYNMQPQAGASSPSNVSSSSNAAKGLMSVAAWPMMQSIAHSQTLVATIAPALPACNRSQSTCSQNRSNLQSGESLSGGDSSIPTYKRKRKSLSEASEEFDRPTKAPKL